MTQSLKEKVADLRKVISQNAYYALTLVANESNDLRWTTQTHWVGFADEANQIEIRAASIVNANRMTQHWRDIFQPYIVVNELAHLYIFLRMGGNALIEENLANEYLPEILAPHPVRRGGYFGFDSLEVLSDAALNKAPTRKHRMKIIERDKYRCRICGHSPNNYVDIELHVHHIKPWGEGGLTVDSNLATLCDTCHKGLDPHGNFGLAVHLLQLDSEHATKKLQRGVRNYRRATQAHEEN